MSDKKAPATVLALHRVSPNSTGKLDGGRIDVPVSAQMRDDFNAVRAVQYRGLTEAELGRLALSEFLYGRLGHARNVVNRGRSGDGSNQG